MLFRQFNKRVIVVTLTVFALLLALPAVYLWVNAPPDPKYKGKRLSILLSDAYSVRVNRQDGPEQARMFRECRDALLHLGPKAGPLLTSWIENRPSQLRDHARKLLLKYKLNWPYFTADHQDIVERLLYQLPEAAIPISEAFQYQILHGQPRDAMRSASLLVFVLNSADAPSRSFIASRSGSFVRALLDRFERDGEDSYPLTLVGLLIKSDPTTLTPEFRQRILKLGDKSRYLGNAVDVVKSTQSAPLTAK